jgi:hypothetical protein
MKMTTTAYTQDPLKQAQQAALAVNKIIGKLEHTKYG